MNVDPNISIENSDVAILNLKFLLFPDSAGNIVDCDI